MADDIEINIGSNPSGIESGSRRASSAVKSVKSEADQLQESFRRLKTMVDPAFAAQEKYNKSLADARNLYREGIISGREFGQMNSALRAQLQATTAELERNSAAGRAAAAEAKAMKDQEAQATRAAAQVAKQEAAAVAAAKKTEAREAAAAVAAALDAEKVAIREAARVAKQEAKDAAAVAKAEARAKTDAERQASRESAEAEKQAKREAAQAARDAANAATTAAKDKRAADRLATTAANEAAEAVRKQAVAERQAANAVNELRASIDPVFASQQRYNQTMATATQLLMQNKLQTGEWAAIQRQARAQMDLNTRSLGRQNQLYIQLGYQAQDVTASLASGINPLVILAQQGGQTAAAMSSMGGVVGKVAAFMAGPWGAAIIGATLLLGFMIDKNKKAKKETLDLRDAEALRAASIKELTEALKAFNKEQTTANTNMQESIRLNQAAAAGALDKARTALNKANEDLKTAKAAYDRAAAEPMSTSKGGNEAQSGRIAMLRAYWESARDAAKAANTAFIAANRAVTETTITKTMADAEAATDATTKATQDFEHAQTAAYATFRKSNQTQADRIILERALTKAIADRKAADDAAAKAARDGADANRDAANADMTRFGNPLTSMTTTSPFGMRNGKMHAGVDLRASVGTPVYAPAAGTVKRADGADAKGYGNLVTINFGGGTEGRFGHLSKMVVKPGQTVNAGDLIGNTGGARGAPGSGDSQAPHLHYEVRRKGKPVDPLKGQYPADAGAAGGNANAEEEARKKALDAQLEDYDFQRQMAEDSYASQVEIQQKKIDAISAFYGAESRETIRAQRELLTMQQRHDKDMLKLKQQQIQAQEQLDEMKLNAEKEAGSASVEDRGGDVDYKQSNGIIGAREAARERQALLDEQYAMEAAFEERLYALKLKALRDQLALLPVESNERVALNAQIEQLEVTHQNTITTIQRNQSRDQKALNREIVEAARQKSTDLANSIGQGMSSMFQGLWTHSQSFLQGIIGIADQVVYKFADMGIKVLTDWIAKQIMMTGIFGATQATQVAVATGAEGAKTAAVVTGAAIRTTAQVTSDGIATASSATSGLAQVAHSAAVAAARVYAAIASIPVVGPFLAPIAAVGALAAVIALGKSIFSAKGGFGQIPSDGTMVETHKDEMILPSWIANPLRNSLKGAAPRGGTLLSQTSSSSLSTSGGFGGSPRPFNPTIHYSAAPGESSSQSARNARQIVKVFKNAYQNREFDDLR